MGPTKNIYFTPFRQLFTSLCFQKWKLAKLFRILEVRMSSLNWPQSFLLSFLPLKHSLLCLLLYRVITMNWNNGLGRKQGNTMTKWRKFQGFSQSLFFNLAAAMKIQLALQSSGKHINANFERLL